MGWWGGGAGGLEGVGGGLVCRRVGVEVGVVCAVFMLQNTGKENGEFFCFVFSSFFFLRGGGVFCFGYVYMRVFFFWGGAGGEVIKRGMLLDAQL